VTTYSAPGAPQLVTPIVSTQWLADHLGSEGLVILDATVLQHADAAGGFVSGRESYLTGHIPGTVFADLIEQFSDPAGEFAFARPDVRRFEAAAASVGIANGTTVVVYDSAMGQWASRIWWLFQAFGYDQVAVLDGGLTKWNLEERPTETGEVEPVPKVFSAIERPESWVDKAYVERVLAGSEEAALVCSSPRKDFIGESGDRPRLGHIPGSHSVPTARLVDRETRAFLPAAALDDVFAPVLAHSQRVVLYCGGGIAAAAGALALTLAGHDDIAVYDGSLNEWVADPEAPVETDLAA
jgi:thiosulfate/3-mercaptopyruvate sulfurtransferase